MMSKHSELKKYPIRDAIAHHVCNWVLRRMASPWYRTQIRGLIVWGLANPYRRGQ